MKEPKLTKNDIDDHEEDLLSVYADEKYNQTAYNGQWYNERSFLLARFARTFCVCTRKSAEEG